MGAPRMYAGMFPAGETSASRFFLRHALQNDLLIGEPVLKDGREIERHAAFISSSAAFRSMKPASGRMSR